MAPLFAAKHDILVVDKTVAESAFAGWVTVAVTVAEQLLASLTVKV